MIDYSSFKGIGGRSEDNLMVGKTEKKNDITVCIEFGLW